MFTTLQAVDGFQLLLDQSDDRLSNGPSLFSNDRNSFINLMGGSQKNDDRIGSLTLLGNNKSSN